MHTGQVSGASGGWRRVTVTPVTLPPRVPPKRGFERQALG